MRSAIDIKWLEADSSFQRDFEFKDFKQALEFVNQVGRIAEKMQHHPDINLHDYKHVSLTLTTHDLGGVSDKDVDLARAIDAL